MFRGLLGTVLALMVVLHLTTLWRERGDIAAAHGDFIIYYTGSEILLDGRAHDLYNLAVQKAYQDRLHVSIRPDPLPYNHPPYELLLFAPLALLPYPYAFLVWGCVNLCLIAAILWLLSSLIDENNRTLIALLWGAFFPITATIWHGQDSILSAFLVVVAITNLKRGRLSGAGIALAFGLYKPQLVLPILFCLAFNRQWSAVLTFTATAFILISVSIAMVGWPGAVQYVDLLRWINGFGYSIDPTKMANLRGVLENFSDLGVPRRMIDLITLGASIGVWCWSLSLWRSTAAADSLFDLRVSHLVVISLLVSYHLYVHDLTLLAIPLSLLLNRGMGMDRNARVAAAASLGGLVLFSMPVVSLMLPTGSMPWTAIGLVYLAVVLAREFRRAEAVSVKAIPHHAPARG